MLSSIGDTRSSIEGWERSKEKGFIEKIFEVVSSMEKSGEPRDSKAHTKRTLGKVNWLLGDASQPLGNARNKREKGQEAEMGEPSSMGNAYPVERG
ncbi:unnamed protein product [Ilex paraguariensis]|uniref:Uncharacterized protein n=1 Tax=Ilex paraguariensis TaxID=185542 RepID=A0ABC8V2R0_9AQUA